MRVLAISAHPDDETLGCGGTLLKHRAQGDEVSWLILTRAMPADWGSELVASQERAVADVSAAYGMQHCLWAGLPTTRLDSLPLNLVIGEIRQALETVRPQLVYLVHGGDIHSDHQVVFQAASIVLKPFLMRSQGVQRVLCYETLSSTEAAPAQTGRMFVPQIFSDIGPYLERKLEIMSLFVSEQQPDPMPRGPSAIRALARYRGASVSCEYAEAFMLLRELM